MRTIQLNRAQIQQGQMTMKILVGLLTLICIAFTHQESDENQSTEVFSAKTGLTIEYGPNLGAGFTDSLGTGRFYVHMTATITNDTTVPIRIDGALSEEYAFPAFCNDTNRYQVFLLPQELTPDTATIYNNIVNGAHDFLYHAATPSSYTRELNPGDFCVVTIGVLHTTPSNCAAVPRGAFTRDSTALYQACDKLVNTAMSVDWNTGLGVKLEYYNKRKFIAPEDGCVVIPFGRFSYVQE